MKQKPEYSTKGKGVLVKLNDTLLPNTTYLFQFKEAIADFTEGNLLPSFEYVFSTGADLDTMSLSGHVLDARSGKPWKETVTVMAYQVESEEWRAENGERRTESDTVACSEQPDFVTRCDKEGNFAFHYIPEGRYRLVALEDKNRNLRVDATDPVAWDTTLVASHPQARRLAASDSIQDNLLAALCPQSHHAENPFGINLLTVLRDRNVALAGSRFLDEESCRSCVDPLLIRDYITEFFHNVIPPFPCEKC
jgi:5-hydroxyisourate hydrolase-like protein (transthyretin family)